MCSSGPLRAAAESRHARARKKTISGTEYARHSGGLLTYGRPSDQGAGHVVSAAALPRPVLVCVWHAENNDWARMHLLTVCDAHSGRTRVLINNAPMVVH